MSPCEDCRFVACDGLVRGCVDERDLELVQLVECSLCLFQDEIVNAALDRNGLLLFLGHDFERQLLVVFRFVVQFDRGSEVAGVREGRRLGDQDWVGDGPGDGEPVDLLVLVVCCDDIDLQGSWFWDVFAEGDRCWFVNGCLRLAQLRNFSIGFECPGCDESCYPLWISLEAECGCSDMAGYIVEFHDDRVSESCGSEFFRRGEFWACRRPAGEFEDFRRSSFSAEIESECISLDVQAFERDFDFCRPCVVESFRRRLDCWLPIFY